MLQMYLALKDKVKAYIRISIRRLFLAYTEKFMIIIPFFSYNAQLLKIPKESNTIKKKRNKREAVTSLYYYMRTNVFRTEHFIVV